MEYALFVWGLQGSLGMVKNPCMNEVAFRAFPSFFAFHHINNSIHHNETIQNEVSLIFPSMVVEGVVRGEGDLHLHFNIGQLNYMKLHVTWSLNWSLTLVGLSTFTVGFHNNIEAYNDFWGETNDVILVLLTLLESRVALIALHGWHSHQRCGDFGWDKDGGPRVSDCYKMTCRGTISIGVALSFMDGYRYYCSPLDMPVIVEKCYGRITGRVWVCRWSIFDNALYASAIHQPTAMWHLPLNHWAFSQD